MSFIEELMEGKGTEELGITYEEPKADENINKLISDNELSPEIQEVIQSAIFGGVGGPEGSLRGLTQLIKSKGGIETLKKLMPDSKNVVKLIKDMNKKSIKNLSKQKNDDVINKFLRKEFIGHTNEGKAALNKALKEGFKGQKAIDKAFVKRPNDTYFIKGNINTNKYTLDMKGNKRRLKKSFEGNDKMLPTGGDGGETPSNILPILSLLATAGLAGYTTNKINEEYDLSSNIAKMLRPDPSMPTKQQNDKDMNLMKMLMSPETQLKYLKNTGQGYPADEEMFLRSETENTNEMLLKLLGQ